MSNDIRPIRVKRDLEEIRTRWLESEYESDDFNPLCCLDDGDESWLREDIAALIDALEPHLPE